MDYDTSWLQSVQRSQDAAVAAANDADDAAVHRIMGSISNATTLDEESTFGQSSPVQYLQLKI